MMSGGICLRTTQTAPQPRPATYRPRPAIGWKQALGSVCLLALAALCAPAAAQSTSTIYRCTDAAGQLTIQSMPCAKGSAQETREVVIPAPPPPPPQALPDAMPPPAAGDEAIHDTGAARPLMFGCRGRDGSLQVQATPCDELAPGTTTAASRTNEPRSRAERLADATFLPLPPPVSQCVGRDGARYLSETTEATASRCVLLQVTGLDGNPRTGAGMACEVVSDTCTRLAENALCEAWQQRLQEAERRQIPGSGAQDQPDDRARLQRIIAGSRCAAAQKP